MSKLGLIVKREYSSRVTKKSFIIMTILGPILIVGFMGLAMWLGGGDQSLKRVLVKNDTSIQLLETDFVASKDLKYNLYNGSIESMFDSLRNSSANWDYCIHLPKNLISGKGATIYYSKSPSGSIDSEMKQSIQKFAESLKLEDYDIDKAQFNEIKKTVNIKSQNIETSEDDALKEKAVIGLVFGVIIYMFIFMYGVQVMRGVIEEKTSRIVEVMISSVKPFTLMMGKILGIGLVALTQFIVWVILSAILLVVLKSTLLSGMEDPSSMMMNSQNLLETGVNDYQSQLADNKIASLIFEQINWGMMLGSFLFYFIFGYLLYGALFAAIGSAVDSEADTQQFMLPVTVPLVLGLYMCIFALDNPSTESIFWFSQVPLTAPVVMMPQVAMGVGILPLITSMVSLISAFFFFTWVAGKIYRTGILMYGKKASWKEMFKWLRYK